LIFLSSRTSCLSLAEKLNIDEKSSTKIDTYRRGYQNGIYNTYEFIEKYSDTDRLLTNLRQHIKQQEIELKNMTS
jgi:hypothetical protein